MCQRVLWCHPSSLLFEEKALHAQQRSCKSTLHVRVALLLWTSEPSLTAFQA